MSKVVAHPQSCRLQAMRQWFCAWWVFCSAAVISVSANPWVVTNSAGDGPGSLREAILASASQAEAIIDLTQLRGIIQWTNPVPPVANALTLLGPGPQALALDARYGMRHFQVASNGSLLMAGLSLMRGMAETETSGGAIHSMGSLVLSNCWLNTNNCYGGFGGAVFSGGRLRASNCRFVGNSVCAAEGLPITIEYPGGYISSGMGGTSAAFGGALMVNAGDAEVLDSTFASNGVNGGNGQPLANCRSRPRTDVTAGRGGGPEGGLPGGNAGFGSGAGFGGGPPGFGGSQFAVYYPGLPVRSPDAGNAAGGAVFVRAGNVRFVGCSFQQNRSDATADSLDQHSGSGGGAVCLLDGALIMDRCSFLQNNTFLGSGGALHQISGTLLLQASSIVSNRLTSANAREALGSGFFAKGGSAIVRNSTFAWNVIQGREGDLGNGINSSGVPEGGGSGCAIAITNHQLRLEHCTIVNNQGMVGSTWPGILECPAGWVPQMPAKAGGLWNLGGVATLRANLFAGNGCFDGRCSVNRPPTPAPVMNRQDILGRVTSDGFNLVEAPTGAEGLSREDLVSVSPLLFPLARTADGLHFIQLRAGSLGINCVPVAALPATDQRGVARPQGPFGDIGSVEHPGDLTIHPPIVVGTLRPIQVAYGAEVELVPFIWNIGPTRYTWFRNGTEIPGAGAETLRLGDVQLADGGEYSVRIEGE